MELDVRILVDDDRLDEAVEILDDNLIANDLDSGDRIMVNEVDLDEIEELFDEAGIDFDII